MQFVIKEAVYFNKSNSNVNKMKHVKQRLVSQYIRKRKMKLSVASKNLPPAEQVPRN